VKPKIKEKKMTKRKTKKADAAEKNINSGENTLRMYLKEINRIPLLSKEEEERIARLAAAGNKEARERLVNSNLRFVVSIAKKYQGQGLPLEDLISEGNIGLLGAIKHFDVNKGYRFITYAVWWIRQAILKAIHEKGRMIRLPVNKTKELIKLKKSNMEYHNDAGSKHDDENRHSPMILDIAQKKAANLLHISQDVLSLEETSQSHLNSQSVKDYIEDDYYSSPVEQATNSILKEELETALEGLEERAADVIRCRYGLGNTVPMTLKEIGARYNLSRERVRQIEKRALLILQHSPDCSNLVNYIA